MFVHETHFSISAKRFALAIISEVRSDSRSKIFLSTRSDDKGLRLLEDSCFSIAGGAAAGAGAGAGAA